MKILLEGQYKSNLFKEFLDDYGHPKNVGQEHYKIIMNSQSSRTEFLKILKSYNEEHTFRYINVDFLYWFEFQNKCSDMLKEFKEFLTKFKTDQSDEESFRQNMKEFEIIVESLFDILNCEKCTNISYFALCDDIRDVLFELMSNKIIGIESTLTKIFDLYDSLLALSAQCKGEFKYGNIDWDLHANMLLDPLLTKFCDLCQQISKVDSEIVQAKMVEHHITELKGIGFKQIQGINYDSQQSFMMKTTMLQLYMSQGLLHKSYKNETLQKNLPPQYIFEVMIDILSNDFIIKDAKDSVLVVMCKLIQIDIVPRFRIQPANKNPYFIESTKYHQTYIDIFKKLTQYHLVDKIAERKGQDQPMHFEGQSQDFIKSQSFLSDFINFLDNIAKCRVRPINQTIFPQILEQVVQVIAVRYDDEVNAYPVNFTCQLSACKLLKNAARSQQSFDDTKILTIVIDKLRHEIEIVAKQSQYQGKEGEKPKGYLSIYNKSWPHDDDYLSKYQNLSQRLMLIKYLLNFLSFCISRNDQNLMSYSQNFVPHSRKILESSLIQDDIMTNIFKIYETLPSQLDQENKDQIEETISPLVFSCIQLVTQVFNDLPAKIQTFISNGVFEGVVNALVNGGIPVSLDMSHTLAHFMHMLTLNQDALKLLKESKLVKTFIKLCLHPEKYYKHIKIRMRRDEYDGLDQLIQQLANQDGELCEQLFEAIIEVSKEILPKSHSLTIDYIKMDQKLRALEKEIQSTKNQDEIQALEEKKNQIKQPYERQQQNFESFFQIYYQRITLLIDSESQGDVSPFLLKNIQKHKDQIMGFIYEGIRNPVVASALHQHANPYLQVISIILNAMDDMEEMEKPTYRGFSQEMADLINNVIEWLQIQIQNMKKLLGSKEANQMQSSLLESDDQINSSQNDPNFNFATLDDMSPKYSKDLKLFEDCDIGSDNEFKQLMNGDSKLTPDDQTAIVLRKIFFYLELLNIFIKQSASSAIGQFKLEFLFNKTGSNLEQCIPSLLDLSTLITKNRGINYQKSMTNDLTKLQALIDKFGSDITDFDYTKNPEEFNPKNYQKIGTSLQKGRMLYFKYKYDRGSISICNDYENLAETAAVMNFECDDTICTNAQACQNQIKRFIKSILINIHKRKKPSHLANLVPCSNFEFCRELGKKQILECMQFIKKGQMFMTGVPSGDSPASIDQDLKDFDMNMFNVISGLFQTHKMMHCHSNIPGAYIRGIFETILEQKDFFKSILNFAVSVTNFIENLLKNNVQVQKFRLSYLKVMWKDISILIWTLHSCQFIILHEIDIQKIIMDFKTDPHDNLYYQPKFKVLTDRQKTKIKLALVNQCQVNLKNMIIEINVNLCQGLVEVDQTSNVFIFMNKYCQDNCFSTLLQVYDSLIVKFDNLKILKMLKTKQVLTSAPNFPENFGLDWERNQMNHVGNMGNNGRYEIYMGQNGLNGDPSAQAMRERLLEHLRSQPDIRIVGENMSAMQPSISAGAEQTQQLIEMGFSKEKVERALIANGNDTDKALDVLLAQQADDDLEKQKTKFLSIQPSDIKPEAEKDSEVSMQVSQIIISDPIDCSSEINGLICKSYKLLTEQILFSKYALDKESEQIYGYQLDMKKFFSSTKALMTELAIFDSESENDSSLQNIQSKMFVQESKQLFQEVDVNFDDLEQLMTLTKRVYIFSQMNKLQFFDRQFFQQNLECSQMKTKNAIKFMTELLVKASNKLESIFSAIFKDQDLKEQTRASRQNVDNELPITEALVQLLQELIWSYISKDDIEQNVSRTVKVGSTLKDFPWTQPAQKSEQSVKERIEVIVQYHQRLGEIFGQEDSNGPQSLDQLEELMMAQINLMRIYNKIPAKIYNQNVDTMYPVTLAISMTQNIFKIGDVFSNQASTDPKLNLRNKFLKSDGLKHLFGVRVMDTKCEIPETFHKLTKKSSTLMSQLRSGGLIHDFIIVLTNDKKSQVLLFENTIKQLMFLQYRENYKRDTKKDITDWYKPVFDALDNQKDQSLQKDQKNQNSASKKHFQTPLSLGKKQKSQQKSVPTDTPSSLLSKNQSKQFKILMSKHECYNEVSLKQFLEFFIQSQCSNPVNDTELFVMACNKVCVIDTAQDSEILENVSLNNIKHQQITTIKLKNSVLKELIISLRKEVTQRSENPSSSKVQSQNFQGNMTQSNWYSEFKKSIADNDHQFQNEIIQQLLDILIHQLKGFKMSILKNFKNNKLNGDDAQDVNIRIDENKLFASKPPKIESKEEEKKEKDVIDLNVFLFNESSVLQTISDIIVLNPAFVGSVLKHREQKTFKYIIRNILAIQNLKIIGEKKQIVFDEDIDELDINISMFFKRMLLDTHTVSKSKKIYRQEARKVFVREICKNLAEFDVQKEPIISKFNSKLLQNYCALLMISQFLMVPDKKLDMSKLDTKVKAVQQQIRRYNNDQKLQMLYQIIFEIQITPQRNQQIKYDGIIINFFKEVMRIRDEIQSAEINMMIRYRPKALTQCVDVLFNIIDRYQRQNRSAWKQLLQRSDNLKLDSGSEAKAQNIGSKVNDSKNDKKGNSSAKQQRQSTIDNVIESESDDGSQSLMKSKSLSHGIDDDDVNEYGEEGSLTLEDQQEIQQLRDDDRRSNNNSISRRTRSNLGQQDLENLDNSYGGYDDEDLDLDEGQEDDLLGDISDDSYDLQELASLADDQSSDDERMEDEEREDIVSASDSIPSDSENTEAMLRRASRNADQEEDSQGEDNGSNDDQDGNSDSYMEDDLNLAEGLSGGNGSLDDMSYGDEGEGEFSDLFSRQGAPNNHDDEYGEDDLDGERDQSFDHPYYNEDDDEVSMPTQYSERQVMMQKQQVINRNGRPEDKDDLGPLDLKPEIMLNADNQNVAPQDLLILKSKGDVEASKGLSLNTVFNRSRERSLSASSNSASHSFSLNAFDQARNQPQRPQEVLSNHLESLNSMIEQFKPNQSGGKSVPFAQGNPMQTRQSKKETEIETSKNLLQDLERIQKHSHSFKDQSIQSKLKLHHHLHCCIDQLLKKLHRDLQLDQNLYITNMTIVNQHINQISMINENANQKQDENMDEFQQSSLVDHVLAPKQAQTSLPGDLHAPNQVKADPDKNKMVSLSNLDGFNEYVKAMKLLQGEQTQEKEVQPEPEKKVDDQIPQQSDNAFDQLDPMFAAALDAPSVQIIKETDQLIRNITRSSSAINQPHIATMNDFIKKQSPEIRSQLLKNLEAPLIAYLSSDLYTEAKRIRQAQNNPVSQVANALSFGQNAHRVRGNRSPRAGGQIGGNRRLPAGPRQGAVISTDVSSRPNQSNGVANTLAANEGEGLRDVAFQRNRFLSVDSQTINIDNMNTRKLSTQRDSESEDLCVPQQRTNFRQNAFFFNIQTFMKENKENLQNIIIKNNLRANGVYQVNQRGQVSAATHASAGSKQKSRNNSKSTMAQDSVIKFIYTNEDLKVFCDGLIYDQLMQKPIAEQSFEENEIVQSINQVAGVIDIAITEVMCCKANMQQSGNSPEKQLMKLRVIAQLPNFRIGLIIKIIHFVKQEIQALVQHIKSEKEKQNARQVPSKIKMYSGQTQIWDMCKAESPKVLSPKECLSYFLTYICDLQDLIFESNSRSNKKEVLDILKKPESDPELKMLCKKLGLHENLNYTLLDQVLLLILEYIQVLSGNPDAFQFAESQQKEFNRWKQAILQNISRILHQANTSLNILKRRDMTDDQITKHEEAFSLSNVTLDMIFQILFFIDHDAHGEANEKLLIRHQMMFLDQSKLSVKMVTQVLSRISLLPLNIEKASPLNGEQDQIVQTCNSQSLLDFSSHTVWKEKAQSLNTVVYAKLSQIINNSMQSFTAFFEHKLVKIGNSQSVLIENDKSEQKELQLIISKILHVFKISINLSFIKINICEDEYLQKVITIVQKIIDNEYESEQEQQSINVPRDSSSNQIQIQIEPSPAPTADHKIDGEASRKSPASHSQKMFLFKEEFKMIMQLIFTLSEYDLKNSETLKLIEQNHVSQPNEGQPSGSQAVNLSQSKQKEQVIIQSCENIKYAFDQDQKTGRISSGKSKEEKPQEQVDKECLELLMQKYKGAERVQTVIQFFFKNKTLINDFIRINQTAASPQFQSIVAAVPQMLNFETKRLLWKVLIKKHLRKNQKDQGEYEIDIGVRRQQVFGDSFQQLKDIQLDSWKQKFTIEFHDEEGVDEGGLTKEWFELISQGIFDPNYALFLQSTNKGSTYYPNPNSVIHEKEELIQLFRFVGRIIGKALCEGQLLDCYFVKALYKMMLGNTLMLEDLEDFDSQLYNSLIYTLENDADILCQTFTLSNKFFDENRDVELKEGGKEIDVTNENKFEYCQNVLHYRLYKCIKVQVDALLQGFHDLVPLNLIKIFDYKELELLISGLPTIDIQDLREHTIYKSYSKASMIIQWLWEVLAEFNNGEKAEFIQFVTGSSKVPVEGFRGLRGTNGIQKVEIVKLVCDKPDGRLPQAHTCFFQLDLPEYSTKEILRQKLFMAIKEGKTFNIA